MTRIPDWADEEAAKLMRVTDDIFFDSEGCGSCDTADPIEIAAALRAAFLRGRVAGLREGAGLVFAAPGSDKATTERFIREHADDLERDRP